MKTYTMTVSAEEAKELDLDGPIVVCNDCGEFAHTEATVKHAKTCVDGESAKWEKFYNEANKEEEND